MKRSEIKSLIFTILPFLIASLIMLPRLLSPQFGLFDDGAMLSEVRRLAQGNFSLAHDIQAGRFRPVYWLYFFIIYILAGPNPFWFFLGHLLIFLILILEIQILMKIAKFNDFQILISSLVFIFSVPIIENFYTLSKGEPLQLVLILSSIILIERLNINKNKYKNLLLLVFSTLCLLAGLMVKETTIIMLPIALFWSGLYKIYNFKNTINSENKSLYLLICIFISFILYLILRIIWGAPPLIGGTYTKQYSLALLPVIENLQRWLIRYAYYYHFLIPLGILTIILLFSSSKRKDSIVLIGKWVIWCVFWFIILIPWDFVAAYYLLPFSLGVSICVGGLTQIFEFDLFMKSTSNKILVIVLLSLSIFLFITNLSHYRTHAMIQLIFDDMNADMLEYTSNNLSDNKTVFVNFETHIEYVDGIELLLKEQYQLLDFSYYFINAEGLKRVRWISDGIVIMPHIQNQPDLTIRSGVDNFFTMAWNEIVLRNMHSRLVSTENYKKDFRIIQVNIPILLCPLIGERGFCENPDPIIDTRIFEYGWEIYQIQ